MQSDFSSIKLRPYQLECCRFLSKSEGTLIRLPCGAGKTITTLYWMGHTPSVKKVVIICPSSVKEMWRTNVEQFFTNCRTYVAEGFYDKSKFRSDVDCLIINYDILYSSKQRLNWVDYIRAFKPDCMVLDEAHKAKEEKSNRTKAVMSLSDSVPYKILLTATPIMNSPKDLYSLIKIMDKNYPLLFKDYSYRYCPPSINSRGQIVYKHPINMPELHTLLRNYMFNKEEKEIFNQMPDYTKMTYYVKLDSIDHILKLQEKLEAAGKGDHQLALATLKRELGVAKLPYVISFIKEWLEDNTTKLVVTPIHREVVEKIHNAFPNSVKFYGGSTEAQKQQALNTFIKDPKCRLFIGNIDSAGVGLDGLQFVSCDILLPELPYTPSTIIQTMGRIRRVNSPFNIFRVHRIIANETLEYAVCKILDNKLIITSHIVQGEEIDPKELFESAKKYKRT